MSEETNCSSVYSFPFFLSVTYSPELWLAQDYPPGDCITEPPLQLGMATSQRAGKWSAGKQGNVHSSESLLLKLRAFTSSFFPPLGWSMDVKG